MNRSTILNVNECKQMSSMQKNAILTRKFYRKESCAHLLQSLQPLQVAWGCEHGTRGPSLIPIVVSLLE